jgi:hypothetical protein
MFTSTIPRSGISEKNLVQVRYTERTQQVRAVRELNQLDPGIPVYLLYCTVSIDHLKQLMLGSDSPHWTILQFVPLFIPQLLLSSPTSSANGRNAAFWLVPVFLALSARTVGRAAVGCVTRPSSAAWVQVRRARWRSRWA